MLEIFQTDWKANSGNESEEWRVINLLGIVINVKENVTKEEKNANLLW